MKKSLYWLADNASSFSLLIGLFAIYNGQDFFGVFCAVTAVVFKMK
jgi:hypothetical protein